MKVFIILFVFNFSFGYADILCTSKEEWQFSCRLDSKSKKKDALYIYHHKESFTAEQGYDVNHFSIIGAPEASWRFTNHPNRKVLFLEQLQNTFSYLFNKFMDNEGKHAIVQLNLEQDKISKSSQLRYLNNNKDWKYTREHFKFNGQVDLTTLVRGKPSVSGASEVKSFFLIFQTNMETDIVFDIDPRAISLIANGQHLEDSLVLLPKKFKKQIKGEIERMKKRLLPQSDFTFSLNYKLITENGDSFLVKEKNPSQILSSNVCRGLLSKKF